MNLTVGFLHGASLTSLYVRPFRIPIPAMISKQPPLPMNEMLGMPPFAIRNASSAAGCSPRGRRNHSPLFTHQALRFVRWKLRRKRRPVLCATVSRNDCFVNNPDTGESQLRKRPGSLAGWRCPACCSPAQERASGAQTSLGFRC